MTSKSLLDVGVLTDRGRRRKENQDTYGFSPIDQLDLSHHTGYLALVADGVGGAKSGSEASRLAKDTFIKAYFAAAAGTVPQRLQSAAALANSAVYNRAQELGGETMATTLVAAAILPTGETHIVNVGDSRAYLYRTGEVKQITRDHNVAALVEGNLDETSQAQAQNRLTRCIGADETTIADAFQIKLAAGEHLLLCSDGLTKHLNGDAELEQHLRRPNQAQATAAALVSLANERGGTDNITVMLIKFGADRARLPAQSGDDLPTVIPLGRGRRNNQSTRLRKLLLILLGLTLALVIGTLIWLSLSGSKYNPFARPTPTRTVTDLPKATSAPTGTKDLDGGNYIGDVSNGLANGQGTLTWPDGTTYTGAFKDNLFNGQGTLTWPDGATYTGAFKDDKIHGQGTITYSDGDIYTGGFEYDETSGQGTYTWRDGTTYTGE